MKLARLRREVLNMHGSEILLIYSGTVTATGDSHTSPIDVRIFKEANFFINVTAKSGTTPTLDVSVVSKNPKYDNWHEVVAFTQIGDALGKEMKSVAANLGEKIALEWTVGGSGSPSYTFTVYAVAKAF